MPIRADRQDGNRENSDFDDRGREDWDAVAKILHWTMALGIAAMFACGIAMDHFLDGNLALKFSVYQFHKSLGFVLLCLAVVRLLWRRTSPNRPQPAVLTKPHERWLADAVHMALYASLIALPLIGWAAASASPLNIPTVVFGLFTLPRLGHADRDLELVFKDAHRFVAMALLGLLTLHVAAALWHHFIRRDNTLLRMLPRRWSAGKARSARANDRSS